MKEIFNELNEVDKVVVVSFKHEFCYACQKIKPKLRKLASERTAEMAFVSVDVSDVRDSVEHFGINKIPTFIAFKGNEEMCRYVGHLEVNLRAFLDRSMEMQKGVTPGQEDLQEDDQDMATAEA